MGKSSMYIASTILFLVIVVGFTYWLSTTEEHAGSEGGHGEQTEESAGGDSAGGEAEKIYSQNCASCHGGDLGGGAGPALEAVGGKYSKDEILGIIKNGKGGGMPAGLIQGKEAEMVAEWLAAKK
ncbi:c-type cytochrome [Guptibacillus algicola]|uniref:c-type cytochrome n=1 Tax=Guptibacillus algicola TaxID=225844 RepID=UPI001CD434B4|nr:c-type cytochrome [Alkalihalobacillus algicola]MCA0989041.1 c-type cytochrome [Alkalihalobacillus algicola]